MRLLRRIARASRRTDSLSLRILLSLGMVVGVGATGTFAAWTDSVTVSGTTISTGTIDLKVNGNDSIVGYSTMNIATMMPGNTTAGAFIVRNAGTAPLKYYLDSSATGTLGAALTVRVTGDSATTGTSPTVKCPSGTATSGAGTVFGPSLLGSAASPRLLAVGATEQVCIEATLPANASTSLEGTTSTITLTFSGTSF